MEAKELRIGNWYQLGFNHSTEQIESISKDGFNCISTDDGKPYGLHSCLIEWENLNEIEPIPLTEEWLVKFGFEKDDEFKSEAHHWSDWIKEGVRITLPYFAFAFDDGTSDIEIKHIHSLQNLYFALTGKELTITP